jgi:dethiobiotin synthetase
VWLNEKNVFVTATDTGVGKTFVSAKLMAMYQEAGETPAYFKPVATGCIYRDDSLISEDVLRIQQKTGFKEDPSLINPVSYELPAAPLIAARMNGESVPLTRIRNNFQALQKKYDCMVVEGIGGILVPLTENFLVIDLVKEWNLGTLIVARPNLGTINHTALTVRVLKDFGVRILGIVISHASFVDPGIGEKSAFEVIENLTGVPILKIFPHEMDWDIPV